MLVVHVHVHVLPGHGDAFATAMLENARESEREPGVLGFEVIRQVDDPVRFLLVEIYRDEAAILAHKQTAHYAKWRDVVAPMMAEPRRGAKYTSLNAAPAPRAVGATDDGRATHHAVSSRGPGERGAVEVNGTRLHYEARGSGPTLLFLHGYTLDCRMWSRQMDALSTSHRVVAYDARGFGRSALPTGAPYRHCDDAASLVEALELGPVIAVGHSIGAHQLLELSLARPDLVVGCVFVCASGLGGIPFPEDVQKLFAAVRRTAIGEGLGAAKRLWSRGGWFASAREMPGLARELDDMLADYSGFHFHNENPSRNIDPPAATRLGELRVPSLVITGGRDLSYNDAVADALAAGIAGATRLRLPLAGHMANMEAPDEVNDAIRAHSARVHARR